MLKIILFLFAFCENSYAMQEKTIPQMTSFQRQMEMRKEHAEERQIEEVKKAYQKILYLYFGKYQNQKIFLR